MIIRVHLSSFYKKILRVSNDSLNYFMCTTVEPE